MRDPTRQASGLNRKAKPEDSCGIPADESYFFFLAFFDPPSIERLLSTSFSADWSFFFSSLSSFRNDLRSLSLSEVPLVNLMKPITTLPRLKIIVQIKNAGIILRGKREIIKMQLHHSQLWRVNPHSARTNAGHAALRSSRRSSGVFGWATAAASSATRSSIHAPITLPSSRSVL